MERRCALLIHSVLVKETASFTTTNGAHFRTLIPFSPSLNAFYLTESIPRSKVTEPVQRGESLSIPFRSLSLDRACFASRVIVNLFNFIPINSRFERWREYVLRFVSRSRIKFRLGGYTDPRDIRVEMEEAVAGLLFEERPCSRER